MCGDLCIRMVSRCRLIGDSCSLVLVWVVCMLIGLSIRLVILSIFELIWWCL